ncbi:MULTISPECIES: CDP-alcohol phosphatidyltransferase family protein [unclassified Pseudodesulfovibrio]|uniref:CDP-alcohol phosphatidyltransferase family protein n=1 Tax=unclassified Pseudodesulfovibrio TaxID=2661612 RepID=UPI000FEB9E20|nr:MULTISPECIES: CDP-alcohol phosphatidyltransferase family protein [unclassified Pseudodesulfovibrio]MCJ2163517.1 CDP-alcohol phosphatidyltransferase family protein [Pseudodesulfovibrio sp. S3-i]RWU06753.1 CDP-alcohol phosphatidyltransferase family protein [Pseudodesulfovibrio sp. S3]
MDYFNDEERDRQKAFAAKRDYVFFPIVRLLMAVKATPNQVSIAGVVCLMLTCLLPKSQAVMATSLMALYVFCDGIDGPLARRMGTAHPGGSLIDIVSDQLGVVFLSAAAIYHLGAWGPVMVIYASSYLIIIGLAVYANSLGIELRKFIRSKYIFFLLYLGSLLADRDLVTYFCAAFAFHYSIETFEALRRIYNHHAEKLEKSVEGRAD